MHHSIEERYIFVCVSLDPLSAPAETVLTACTSQKDARIRKSFYPYFRQFRVSQCKQKHDHHDEHKKIHKGLDKYEAYIESVQKKEKDYDPNEFREIMDSFKEILFYRTSSSLRETLLADCGK